MNIEFFFNWTQEDEGSEIIHFPCVLISRLSQDGKIKYWTEAAFFIQSIDTADSAFRILNIIKNYKLEQIVKKIELNLWNDVQATIENNFIMFRRIDSAPYEDKLDLDRFEKIISRWTEYLQNIDKELIVFEIT